MGGAESIGELRKLKLFLEDALIVGTFEGNKFDVGGEFFGVKKNQMIGEKFLKRRNQDSLEWNILWREGGP